MPPYSDQHQLHRTSQDSTVDPESIWFANPMEMGDIGFISPSLCRVCLPLGEPDGGSWLRTNGNFSLSIQETAAETDTGELLPIGLPFGAFPRLLLAYISTVAVKQANDPTVKNPRVINFGSVRHMLLTFGFSTNRTLSYVSLRDQMERLFSTAFTFHVKAVQDLSSNGKPLATETSKFTRFFVAQKQTSVFLKSGDRSLLLSPQIELSPEAFSLLVQKPCPFAWSVLRGLRKHPMSIDIYFWLNHRMSYLRKPQFIAWPLLREQLGSRHKRDRNFNASFKIALQNLHVFWPNLRVCFRTSGGITLYPSELLNQPTKAFQKPSAF